MVSCSHSFTSSNRVRFFAVSLIAFSILSSTQMRFMVEGRTLSKRINSSPSVVVEKAMVARIGSRPPRCERRCSSCEHCEAIQVPTNPQAKSGNKNSTIVSNIAYARGEDNSNYKPMSWKCKCGNYIFNP
ncbi:hypothetical protein UlMin_038961 [Ulmus minor]